MVSNPLLLLIAPVIKSISRPPATNTSLSVAFPPLRAVILAPLTLYTRPTFRKITRLPVALTTSYVAETSVSLSPLNISNTLYLAFLIPLTT